MAKYKKLLTGFVGAVTMLVSVAVPYGAASAFTVSPQDQEYVLAPGQTVTGEVKATNPNDAGGDFYYIAEVVPYSVSDDGKYSLSFDAENDHTDIVNWVTMSDDDESDEKEVHGVLKPGETASAYYTITVPKDARGGGQYFAVRVKNDAEAAQKAEKDDTVVIKEVIGIASLVFVEVSGDIIVKGEITDNDIPSFFLAPPISASFVVKNEGNTHAKVSYYLQVFPLFSDEEIYTTEEKMETKYVLPGASRVITQTWADTPAIGMFKVKQTVYYDSLDSEPSVTERTVIVCPVWLLFLIIFAIVALILWIIMRVRSRGKKERKTEKKTEGAASAE
ncbi:hypothetical protein IKE82_01825 [Candidatus Saccharibacteria bacterium]|nr:hypothetical protein [Candidatus Saccharibacteria bacterium]